MKKNKRDYTIVILGVVVFAATLSISCFAGIVDRSPPPVIKPSFEGNSRNLRATKIVTTLDAPIDGKSNVVWCASFLAAWKALEIDVAKEPLSLQGFSKAALDLSRASDLRSNISKESLYAAAGRNQEGITDKILKDLATKFPSKSPPTFHGIVPDSFVMYAFLEANIKFSLPYFQNRKPLVFTDRRGVKTELNSFGIRVEDDYAYFDLREQPRIMYEARGDNYELAECIFDLDYTSTPNQIILALVAPKSTLAETLSTIEDKIDNLKKLHDYNGIGINDVLIVPDMVFRISHRFTELEGKEFTNSKLKGQRIDIAQQDIQFHLDRSGVELKSEAKSYAMPAATHYIFNRPFLLQMKKRGAEKPYFVMWVENAELLNKWH